MVPVPVEVRVIVPLPVLIVPARAMDELVPESVMDTEPLDEVVSPPVPTVIVAEFALSVREMDAGLFVALEIETVVLVSVRVTLAVVLREIVPAEVVRLPMEPAPAEVLTRLRVPEVVRA